MLIRILAFVWICLCTFAANATTQMLPMPAVAYSADRVIESEAGTFTGKVYSSFGLESTELHAGGVQSVMILRPDKDLGWMLMPAQHMYQVLDFNKAREQAGGSPASDVQIDVVGSELIEGVNTTKYKLMLTDGSAGGFMWFTAEGIALKMDLLAKEDGRKSRLTLTLKNLVTGDQDPALFDLPSGYNPMPGMGSFGLANTASQANAGSTADPSSKASDAAGSAAVSGQKPADDTVFAPASVAREAAKQLLFKLPGLRNR